MADQRIQSTERLVGAGHPTLADTLNRLALVEHNEDGSHRGAYVVLVSEKGAPLGVYPARADTRRAHWQGR